MKRVITPVVTESIVSYLLRCVNEDGRFSRVYSCVMSEANLVRAWFEIKNRSWRLVGLKYDNFNKLENLALSWFQKVNRRLVLDQYNYDCTRIVTILKKNIGKCWILVSNLYSRIVQKAVYQVFYVIFEGYFYWEKTCTETVSKNCGKAISYRQIVKRKGRQEYWFRYFKIKPIFLSLSCYFRLKKEVYSIVRVLRTWNPRWLVSYDFSKWFQCVGTNVFTNRLKKYIKDRRLTGEITKLLQVKIANFTRVVPKDVARVFQSNLILFFNLYIDSFDKFVAKIESSVNWKNNLKLRCGFNRVKRLYLNEIKKLPVAVQRPIIKKHTMSKIKKGILLRENYLEKTSVQMYYVRCNYSFLMGFFMNKVQSRQILEDLFKFIKKKLNFDVPKNLLSHISNEKIKFLGFEIRRIPVSTLKQFANKKLEAYKRHQNKNYREGVRDYMQFLKAVEWMRREVAVSVVVQKRIPPNYIIAEKKLKKKIVGLVPQEYWFYNGSKMNLKMKLASKIRYEDQYFRLHRWINTKKSFIHSHKTIRLIRFKRKNPCNSIKKAIGLKYERFYPLKLQCVTTDIAKTNLIFELKILFPKKKVTAEFKRKNVLSSIGASGIFLSDIAIICWYSRTCRKLLSYYGCIADFSGLKHQVNSILRYSLFEIIRVKYNKSIGWVISHFGFDPRVKSSNKLSINFPSIEWINSRKKKYVTQAWGMQNLDLIRNNNLLYLDQIGIMLDSFKFKSLY